LESNLAGHPKYQKTRIVA